MLKLHFWGCKGLSQIYLVQKRGNQKGGGKRKRKGLNITNQAVWGGNIVQVCSLGSVIIKQARKAALLCVELQTQLIGKNEDKYWSVCHSCNLRLFLGGASLNELFKILLRRLLFWSVNDEQASYAKDQRQLGTQIKVEGPSPAAFAPPQRTVCATAWLISDKAIKPPIHMFLGAFSDPASHLPASCPFERSGEYCCWCCGEVWFIFKYTPNPPN